MIAKLSPHGATMARLRLVDTPCRQQPTGLSPQDANFQPLFWGTSGGTSNPSPETFDFLWWLLSCRSGPWR